mgnify:CR=1 FL=1
MPSSILSAFTSSVQRLLFDTGAATHVCPLHFCSEYGTFHRHDVPTVSGSGEIQLQVYGWRSIPFTFETREGSSVTLVFTFVVCDCSEPILSFNDLNETGVSATLSDEQFIQLQHKETIPIHSEDRHLWLHGTPVNKTSSENVVNVKNYSITSSLQIEDVTPVFMPPSFTSGKQLHEKKATAGQTDFWEFFKHQGILRRVHKIPRVFMFVPKEGMLPHGFTLDMISSYRKTVVHTIGSDIAINDSWNSDNLRQRLQDIIGEWTSYTEFNFIQPTTTTNATTTSSTTTKP